MKSNKKSFIIKPRVSEKAIMAIESQNTLEFEVSANVTKNQIKQKVEELFDVKVEKIRTSILKNRKIAYVKLNKNNLAIDIATKLGMI
ncbi:MAG: 50S ribosomal protein L23 [Nanoarchaeota archaeon]